MLASQISGKPIDYALLQMKFSEKRASKHVEAILEELKTKAILEKMPVKKLIVCKLAVTLLELEHRPYSLPSYGVFFVCVCSDAQLLIFNSRSLGRQIPRSKTNRH